MYHKYEGMTDMLTVTMTEELTNIITSVTGDARHRRDIYETDQDFERFGKTLIANFKDTSTLWEFLRVSLHQCHIHKLSKVGKDKAAWAKADEYLTNLMDSDTVLTLENTDETIKLSQNYMHRQDNDGEKHVAFSSASDESNDDEEVRHIEPRIKKKTSVCRHYRSSSTASQTSKRTAATSARSRQGRMKKNAPTAKRLASGSDKTRRPPIGGLTFTYPHPRPCAMSVWEPP